ncbi:MAG: cation-transporting P-type ATPase [archaeon]
MDYHAKEVKEIFKDLKTSNKGLDIKEAEKRLKKYSKNSIKKIHRLRPLKIFIEQFKSFLIYILLIAMVVSFFIGHTIDGSIILAIIIINSAIGFFQQYKAEKSILALKDLVVPKSKVIRQGKMIEIKSSSLVPGDIVVFSTGEKINADCRIFELDNLKTNEAILTGESLPVLKSLKVLSKKVSLHNQDNMLFTGTQIVNGTGKAVVVETGMNTVFGKIAESLQEIETQKTPMQKRLDKFSKQIGFIIIGFVAIVIALGFLEFFNLAQMFLTAVALAVSAIPEGLPAVLTMSFAISSLMMSKKNVLIRRLPAVESLGSVTVICSDKTGTLTEEKMHIKEIFTNNKFFKKKAKELFNNEKKVIPKQDENLSMLIKTSVLCNSARFEKTKNTYEFYGDPTESVLISAALDFDFNKKTLIEKNPSIKKFEFDSKRKMMSVVRETKNKKTIYSKGAIEKILKVCNSELIGGKVKLLTEKRKKQLREKAKKMEEKAFRVLAFAYKDLEKKEKMQEKNLVFLGFVGMIDPPRPEVKDAIQKCKEAGIKIKIITGDAALTAKTIANQIGITGKIVTEVELNKMSDAMLSKEIDNIVIFARTTPHQKLRITKILQEKGEVVAITGDGVNDALALKSADIGVAMGIRGTDVSREVSDIILTDDNFASIVEGVKQGRKTYDNIKKIAKYFLAVNFSEIFLILIALILGMLFGADKWFLPLLPLQILWINLITDSFPALTLVFEKSEDIMKTPPRKEKSLLDGIWKFVIAAGVFTLVVKFIVYLIGINNAIGIAKTQTLVLTTAIFFELLFVYTCRSNKPLTKIGIFSNKWLNYSIILSFILHFVLLYTPLGSLFGVVPLAFKDWFFILPFAFSGVVVFESWKYFKEKK